MADETSDTVTFKQISSFIRYIDFNTKVPIIRKDFFKLCFFLRFKWFRFSISKNLKEPKH